MNLQLQTAPTYSIVDLSRSNHLAPSWTRWGWCKINEVLELINREYGLRWKKRDLLSRFALEFSDVAGTGKKSSQMKQTLRIVLNRNERYSFIEFTKEQLPQLGSSTQDFLVPAGWVKEILWALYNEGRRFKRIENEIVVCTEDGDGIYYA